MSVNTQVKIMNELKPRVESMVYEKGLGLKLIKTTYKKESNISSLYTFIFTNKKQNFYLIFETRIPNELFTGDVRPVVYKLNEILMYHINQLPLVSLIQNVNIIWGLVFHVEFNQLLETTGVVKDIVYYPDPLITITVTEITERPLFILSIKKKEPKYVMDDKSLKALVNAMIQTRELAVYDYKVAFRNAVEKIRQLFINLSMYSNHVSARFYSLEATVEYTTNGGRLYVLVKRQDGTTKRVVYPLKVIREQGGQDKLIRSIHANLVS